MENERGQGKGRLAKDGSKWRVPAGLVQREGVVGWVHGQRCLRVRCRACLPHFSCRADDIATRASQLRSA